VDKEKGYIDLSKRRVNKGEVEICVDKYTQSKAVHSILHHVSEITKVRLEDLYSSFVWDLYTKYGHAYDAFKLLVSKGEEILEQYDDVSVEVKTALLTSIRRRLTPQAVRIHAELDVSCFVYAGIDAIRRALKAGEQCSTEDMEIKITLKAPPRYELVTTSYNRDAGIEIMEKAIGVITSTIKAEGGDLVVAKPPRADDDDEGTPLDLAAKDDDDGGD